MMALEHHHFDIPNDYWSEMAANIKKYKTSLQLNECCEHTTNILAKGNEPKFIKASGSMVNFQEIYRTGEYVRTVLSMQSAKCSLGNSTGQMA